MRGFYIHLVFFLMKEEFGTMISLYMFSLLMTIVPSHSQFNPLDAIKVRSAISLPGCVLTNEDALKLLQRHAEVTYQVNLPRHLEELRQIKTLHCMKTDFSNRNFAILGSLATLDAGHHVLRGSQECQCCQKRQWRETISSSTESNQRQIAYWSSTPQRCKKHRLVA